MGLRNGRNYLGGASVPRAPGRRGRGTGEASRKRDWLGKESVTGLEEEGCVRPARAQQAGGPGRGWGAGLEQVIPVGGQAACTGPSPGGRGSLRALARSGPIRAGFMATVRRTGWGARSRGQPRWASHLDTHDWK